MRVWFNPPSNTLHGSELVFEGNIFDVIERLLKKSLSQYDFLGKPKSYFFLYFMSKKFSTVTVIFLHFQCRKKLKSFDFGQMNIKEFGHSKATEFVSTKNLGHLCVRGEILFVFWILKFMFLQVSPKLLDAFGPEKMWKRLRDLVCGRFFHDWNETGKRYFFIW